jgi:hypothetical protein
MLDIFFQAFIFQEKIILHTKPQRHQEHKEKCKTLKTYKISIFFLFLVTLCLCVRILVCEAHEGASADAPEDTARRGAKQTNNY